MERVRPDWPERCALQIVDMLNPDRLEQTMKEQWVEILTFPVVWIGFYVYLIRYCLRETKKAVHSGYTASEKDNLV